MRIVFENFREKFSTNYKICLYVYHKICFYKKKVKYAKCIKNLLFWNTLLCY